jgi:hypothetical protein
MTCPEKQKSKLLKSLLNTTLRLLAADFPCTAVCTTPAIFQLLDRIRLFGMPNNDRLDLPSVQPPIEHISIISALRFSLISGLVGYATSHHFLERRHPYPSDKFFTGSTFHEYIASRIERELACIGQFNRFPRQQGLFSGPGQYTPTAASKTRVLNTFSKAVPLLTPKDAALVKPSLWHPDLHADNIFVDPSNPTDIVSIIDWQAVSTSPLFLQVSHPSLIEFEGPVTPGFEPIPLPDDFDSMSPEKQLEAEKLRAAQSIYKIYEVYLAQNCPEALHSLRFRDSLAGQIFRLAGSVFSDGEPVLMGMLMHMHDEWTKKSSSSPLSFTPEDRKRQEEDERLWGQGVELLAGLLDQVGAFQGWDGWVNHNNYEAMKASLANGVERFLDQHARNDEERRLWSEVLPFKDDPIGP